VPQNQEHKISVDQLQVGVYVYLDVGWMRHPFGFNNFKIRDEEQLQTIRTLGLASVRWDPARSDLKPLPKVRDVPPQPEAEAEPTIEPTIEPVAMMVEKQARIQALAEHRINMAKVEQAFAGAASMVRDMGKSIHVQPEKAVAEAAQLIGDMVDSLLLAPDLAIQVMAEKPGSEDVYFHSLNVSVLAMIVAREVGLPAEIVRQIGIGALFHDIGLNEVPAKILLNPGTLTKAEREFREVHCQFGLDIARKAGLSQGVLNIVHQHHEYFDGSGYPRKLKGDAIDPLARLVALVNAFDNLCNPVNLAQALTPHEALSHMFSKQRNLYDPKLLQVFIRFMGVYPPGTVVGLSNDAFGLVVKVNAARALKPTVMVHDAGIPKSEALILDLAKEPGVNITRAIRPIQLPPDVYDYLSPRRRVSYYFDEGRPGGAVS
jgi:putative nucleotidyltransferase with HDIG domain